MSDQRDSQIPGELDQLNDDLVRGLKACHSIIDDYRSKFAANRDRAVPANEDEVPTDGLDEDSRHG